jgi:hypothetical protein
LQTSGANAFANSKRISLAEFSPPEHDTANATFSTGIDNLLDRPARSVAIQVVSQRGGVQGKSGKVTQRSAP